MPDTPRTSNSEIGLPPWAVLMDIYQAVREEARLLGILRPFDKALDSFRQQMVHYPALQPHAAQLNIDSPLGRHPVTEEELEAILSVGTLAIPDPTIRTGISSRIRAIAIVADLALRAYRQLRYGQVDPTAFQALGGQLESAALELAGGLDRVSRITPVVIFLDRVELLAKSTAWLRFVANRIGHRVVFVVGIRMPAGSQANKELHPYHEEMLDRVRIMELEPFDSEHLLQYLRRRGAVVDDSSSELDSLFRVTRGVPLAVVVACDLLLLGVSPKEFVV